MEDENDLSYELKWGAWRFEKSQTFSNKSQAQAFAIRNKLHLFKHVIITEKRNISLSKLLLTC